MGIWPQDSHKTGKISSKFLKNSHKHLTSKTLKKTVTLKCGCINTCIRGHDHIMHMKRSDRLQSQPSGPHRAAVLCPTQTQQERVKQITTDGCISRPPANRQPKVSTDTLGSHLDTSFSRMLQSSSTLNSKSFNKLPGFDLDICPTYWDDRSTLWF